MRMRNLMKQAGVFLAWVAVSALGLWIALVGRSALMQLLVTYYIGASVRRKLRARFFDQVYFVLAGLLYLVFIFAIENYLRKGLSHGDALRRFSKTIGLELLVLFPLDLVTSLLERAVLRPLSLILLTAELILGAALTVYALRRRPNPPEFFVSEEDGTAGP